jgi:cyanophycinase-like exopeptidase
VINGLKQVFSVQEIAVLDTKDRSKANSDQFVAPLKQATFVFIDGGASMAAGGFVSRHPCADRTAKRPKAWGSHRWQLRWSQHSSVVPSEGRPQRS